MVKRIGRGPVVGLGCAMVMASVFVAGFAQIGLGQPVKPAAILPAAIRQSPTGKRAGVARMSSKMVAGVAGQPSNGAGGGGSGGGHLIYGGSALMQNTKLFQVIWGAPGPGRTFQADVTNGHLAAAYQAYVSGSLFDWISSEYTIGLYHIGRSTFAGTVTLNLIRPQSKAAMLDSDAIEAELGAQIDAHVLPSDANAMFMIDFPAEVDVKQGGSYGRGAGSIPIGCVDGREEQAGLCYTACKPGFSGVGPVCWGACPPDHHNDGATCRKDVQIVAKASYGRGVGTVPSGNCGSKEMDAGLCYDPCPSGFHGVGPVCWQQCPAGFHDDGATCRKDASIIGADNSKCPWWDKCGLVGARGCSKCPADYHDDGCTCRRDVNIIAKQSRGRGVGTVPARGCNASSELDAGLCYTRCRDGFHGVGPVCWGTCPAGFHDDGATCRIDANIIARPSYGRGVGTPRTKCKAGDEFDTGLCYQKCDAQYHGVGPVCWGFDSFCQGHDGFCGFHSSTLRGTTRMRYGVLADMVGSPCSGNCWSTNPFLALTKTATHELTEAITDPDLNLGWNDVSNGEIADICNSLFTTAAISAGSDSFAVQEEWSNSGNTCR